MDTTGETTVGDQGDDGARTGTLAMLGLMIALVGDDVGLYKDVGEPPEGFCATVRGATTPVLRAMLLQITAEMDRRRTEQGTP